MEILLDYSLDKLKEEMKILGFPSFRAEQIYKGLLSGKDLKEISTLPKNFIDEISKKYITTLPKIAELQQSSDGTKKLALKYSDGAIVECVLMSYKYGNTLCISTQVGCKMGCKFCASTIGGFIRNLSSGEMLEEVIVANKILGGNHNDRKITNIVLMGCGEPLDNYDNVTKFFDVISSKDTFNISERNISISTCGIVNKIYKLADDNYKVTLTISLHSANNEKRKQIMPIANKYNLNEIMSAVDYYFKKSGRRVVFEYVLLSGFNDSEDSISELHNLVGKRGIHINVINLNSITESSLKGVKTSDAYKFVEKLTNLGMSATLRRTLGKDIDGACGQLRNKIKKD